MSRKVTFAKLGALVVFTVMTWAGIGTPLAFGQISPLFSGTDLSTLTSSDGSTRIQMKELDAESYLVTYTSTDDTLDMVVSPGLLEIGPFSVQIVAVNSGTAGEFELSVVTPSGAASTRLVYDPTVAASGCAVPVELEDGTVVSQRLDELALSREGVLLREASAFILEKLQLSEGMLRDASRATACEYLGPPQGGPPNGMFSWTCLGAVLNQVAAGAAMVGGCGTPACGPAYGWCCASGVAWYASAFVGTWNACS